jgi:predicted methyltransferase
MSKKELMKHPANSPIFVSISLVLAMSLCSCSEQPQSQVNDHIVPQTLYTAVAHPDRPDADKQRDKRRKPAQVLEYLGVNPGMTVLEVMSGGGYYSELLSRVVGANGKVYSHNNKMYYDFQSDKFVEQRLEDNRLPNVIRWDKELNDLQLESNSLDATFMMLVYHDFYWSNDKPQQVLAQLYQALKPGGILGIVDHAAPQNSGSRDAESLHGSHRIDEMLVKKSLLSAGFVLDGGSNLLRNPNDDRNKPFFDKALMGQATDRFILRFKKPLNTVNENE